LARLKEAITLNSALIGLAISETAVEAPNRKPLDARKGTDDVWQFPQGIQRNTHHD
jgi:hypothetical protein